MFYYFQDKLKLLEGKLEFKEHKYMFNGYEMELYSVVCRLRSNPQSRQSTKLFSSRRNWGSPNPSPAGEWAPPPRFLGEGHTRLQ